MNQPRAGPPASRPVPVEGDKTAGTTSTRSTSDVVPASEMDSAGTAPPTDVSSFLAWTWPFSELPRRVTDELQAEMHTREFAAGDVLIRQGEPSTCLLAILEGNIEVRVEDEGQTHEVAEAGTSTILGEMGLVTEQPCTATVVAKTPIRALVLPADRFRRLAARHNVLWVALSRLVAERLGRVEVDVLTGKVVEGYRIKRAVGRGGMAVVYEAERLRDGRHVALKMMSHRYTHNLEVQRRFEREVSICRSLDHPNISRIHDCFTSLGTNFMVMEFCDGVTLTQVVRRHKGLPREEVRKIVGQLAAALDYAHRRGVCHRDLKPSNAMLDRRGTLKLMDFGLAKTHESPDLTRIGDILGTPRYMPPEQLAGKRVDARADLFAFGCIVAELLTGKPLFRGNDILAIIVSQMQWSLPSADEFLPGLDDELHGVLRQTLTKEPEGRVLELSRLLPWAAPVDAGLLE